MSEAVRQPKYRKQKARPYDRAFVVLNGRRVYLSLYRSEESRQKYDQVVSEWSASGRRPAIPPYQITIVQLIARYWSHALVYYRRPNGTHSTEPNSMRQAMMAAQSDLRKPARPSTRPEETQNRSPADD